MNAGTTRIRRWLARGGQIINPLATGSRSALALLLPPRCAYCSVDLPEQVSPTGAARAPLRASSFLLLCSTCANTLTIHPQKCCPQCGAVDVGSSCRECAQGNFQFEQLAHLGAYRGDLRQAVLKTKHGQHEHLARALAELLWERVGSALQQFQPDVVVPIPMHWRRRLLRSGHAPETLARCLAKQLGIPAYPLLRQKRATTPQHHLGRKERRTNVTGAFRMRRGFLCRDARVLLVDDVVTTGATVNEATRVLLAAGAARVAVAAFARAEAPA